MAPAKSTPKPDLGDAYCAPGQGCNIGDLFRLLGKAHVMDILYQFHLDNKALRFVEIQNRLKISPNTLSDRLKDLVEVGLLRRIAYNEIPPRVDYEVTAKANDLKPVFRSLFSWCQRHSLAPEPVVATVASPKTPK